MSGRLTATIGATPLVDAFGIRTSQRTNRVGEGELSLLPDDPQLELISRHDIIEIAKDGIPYFWLRVDAINQIDAEDGSDDDETRVVISGPESLGELDRVTVMPPFFGIDGRGQTAGRKVSVDPWDSTRLFGYPDPTQATQLLGTAGGADDVTAITASRPDGWPDPQAYWVGDAGGATDCYFAAAISAGDVTGDRFHIFVAFDGEGWLYHQGVLICHVPAAESNRSKCRRIEVPVNPGVTQEFTARVRTTGTDSPNALLAVTVHDPDAYDPAFFFKTSSAVGQTWGMFADPATPPGCTPGELVTQILNEYAQVEDDALSWSLTFNGELDTDGREWPTIPILPTTVGDSLPTVLERLSEAWVDWGIETNEAGRTLSMWSAAGVETPTGTAPGRGQVRSIELAKGDQLVDVARDERGPIVNAYNVQWDRGYVRVQDDASVALYGAHTGTLDASGLSDIATVERLARQNLAITAWPTVSITAAIHDTDPESGWSPVTDWFICDTLTVTSDFGSESIRCAALEIEESDDYIEVAAEWGTSRDALEEQHDRWMSRTQNGTLDGRSPTPTVSVSSPSIVRQGVAQVFPITIGSTGSYAVVVGDIANRARRHVNGWIYAINVTAENAGLADSVAKFDIDGTVFLSGVTLPAGEDDVTLWLSYAQLKWLSAANSLNVEITAAGGAQGWTANVLVAPIGDQPS